MEFKSDKQINVRMSYDLYEKSKQLADESEWTLAAWIRKAMEEKVNRDLGSGASQTEKDSITRAEIRKMIREELGDSSFNIIQSKKEYKQRL